MDASLYVPLLALAVGAFQLAHAGIWFLLERQRTFVVGAALLLITFSAANIIDSVYYFFPDQPVAVAQAYALVAPLVAVGFLALTISVFRPDWLEGRGLWLFLAFDAILMFFVIADVVSGAGYYFRIPNVIPETMSPFITSGVMEPVVQGFIFFSIGFPWLMFLLALLRGWNKAERTQQYIFLGSLLASYGANRAFEPIFQDTSSNLISNAFLSAGLLVIMLYGVFRSSESMGAAGKDLPIGRKLGYGFGGLFAFMVYVALLSSYAIAQLNAQVQAVLSTQNQIAQASTLLQNSYNAARRAERDFALMSRTRGLQAATQDPQQRWRRSMEDIAWLLDGTGLQGLALSPAQRERVRALITRYDLYYDEAEQFFNEYVRRGDNTRGAINNWIQQAQFMDVLLNSDPITSREFNASLVNLRNLQFYYLTSQNEALADEIRREYDNLQEQILFGEITTPLALRVNLQQALESEALGFDAVRDATRNIEVRERSLDGAASNLGAQIQSLRDQVNEEFDSGVAALDRQRQFYVVTIIATSVAALFAGATWAFLLVRQITRPVTALAAAANQMGSGSLGVRAPVYSQDEIGVAALAFNSMAASLDDLLRSLEERVRQRTAQLETAAQVASEAAGSMMELQSLLDLTTTLIVERFKNIYHAQVFLIDRQGEGDIAILRSSTGEAGRQLLARQHRLPVAGQSVIGRTTSSGQYVLARADDEGTVHRPNELLPETRAELALPMRRGDHIIGALDVQAKTTDAFGEDDIQVLQILADQLTIAVENARLFRDANLSLRETSRLFTASARIATAQSRDEVLDVFSDIAAELDQFDRLMVMFFSEFDTQGIPLVGQSVRRWSHDEGIIHMRTVHNLAPVSQELQEIARNGFFENPDLNNFTSPAPDLQAAFRAVGSQSALMLALQAAGNFLGILILQRKEVGAFPEDTKRIFQVLAQQASVALNRFVLLDELTMNVEDLRKIRESYLDIASATSLDRLYTQMAPRAASLMRSEAAAIYTYDESNDVMRLVALSGIDNRFIGEELHRGEGAAGQLIERREPFTLQSYAAYKQQPVSHFGERFGPTIAAPLIWQDHLLGAIVAANPPDYTPFTPEDRDRLILFTDQAALAIQNTRLLDASTRSLKEQRQLYQSTQALLGGGREEELVTAIASNLSEANEEIVAVVKGIQFPQPALVVVGVNEAQWEANTFPKSQYRYAGDLFPMRAQIPARLFVPEGAQIWEMTPIRAHLRTIDHEMAQTWQQLHGFQHMMVVPIFVREGFWGAIIQMRRDANPYSREDEIRATTVATQFAVALDNIRLLGESQRAAEQLTTAAEVSRVASSRLDVEEVLERSVNLIRERFGHYHVQVFLVDDQREWANLRASTGSVGATMLERKHRLAVGSQSVIGTVTATGEYVLARAASVDTLTVHRFNELLPETKTELALPMMIGERVVGALDVQSVHPDAFANTADIAILQTLAGQMAVAVENSRLYEDAQVAAEENRALYNASLALNESHNSDDVAHAIKTHIIGDPEAIVSIVRVEVDANNLIQEADVIANTLPRTPDRVMRRFDQRTLPTLQTMDIGHRVYIDGNVPESTTISGTEKAIMVAMNVGAIMSVPLRLSKESIGAIMVTFPKPRKITERDTVRLNNITAQTAITLQNRDLLQSTEQSLEESRLLYQASAAINTAGNANALLEAIRPVAAELNPAQIVLMMFDEPLFEGARPMRMHVTDGLTITREFFDVGTALYARDLPLFRNISVNNIVALEDVYAATHLSEQERDELQDLQLRSLLYLPLQVGSRYLGYIGFNMSRPVRLRDSLIQRLQTVVQQASSALQTQQYYTQAQRRAWREEQISRITAALSTASDPNEVLRIGLQELKQTLQVKRATGWIEPTSPVEKPATPAKRLEASPADSVSTNGAGSNGANGSGTRTNGTNGHH